MVDSNQQASDFFLLNTRPVSRMLRIFHFGGSQWKLAFFLLALTWLPLLVITFVEETLISGPELPFIKDISIHGRLLIGVPMMVLIKNMVYKNVPRVLNYFADVLISPEDRHVFISGPLKKARRSSNSGVVFGVFLLLVIGITFVTIKGTGVIGVPVENDSWFYSIEKGGKTMSTAGVWANYISLPVFQFLVLLWIWRYLVWVKLLYRISRMKIILQPTHPDGTGGLGIFVIAQRNFILFFIVCGLVISCRMMGFLSQGKVSFDLVRVEILGYIGFCIFVLFCPLAFFTPKLIRTKWQGLIELSMAGSNLSQKFEGNWVGPLKKGRPVTEDFVDPSMQYDYSGIYSLLQDMRIMPLRLGDLAIMSLFLFIPFLPVFFIQFSIFELLQKILGLLV